MSEHWRCDAADIRLSYSSFFKVAAAFVLADRNLRESHNYGVVTGRAQAPRTSSKLTSKTAIIRAVITLDILEEIVSLLGIVLNWSLINIIKVI